MKPAFLFVAAALLVAGCSSKKKLAAEEDADQRGLEAYQKGDADLAITDYSEAIRLNPKDAGAYANRGVAYAAKSDFDKALADYTRAIQLDPKDAKSYFNRGVADKAQGDYDKAFADYSQAIQLDPQDADFYCNRGMIDHARSDYAKALADYAEAIRLNPDHVVARNDRAWILATCPQAPFRNGKQAVEDATRACELTGWKKLGVLDTLAAAYAEAGDFDNAIKWESHCLESSDVPPETAAEIKSRLTLYHAHKPYHAE